MSLSIFDTDLTTMEYLSKTPKERRKIMSETCDFLTAVYGILAIGAVVLVCYGLKHDWFI